jgi:hypothetical protein
MPSQNTKLELLVQVETFFKERSAFKFSYSIPLKNFIKKCEKSFWQNEDKYWMLGVKDVEKVTNEAKRLGFVVTFQDFINPDKKPLKANIVVAYIENHGTIEQSLEITRTKEQEVIFFDFKKLSKSLSEVMNDLTKKLLNGQQKYGRYVEYREGICMFKYRGSLKDFEEFFRSNYFQIDHDLQTSLPDYTDYVFDTDYDSEYSIPKKRGYDCL